MLRRVKESARQKRLSHNVLEEWGKKVCRFDLADVSEYQKGHSHGAEEDTDYQDCR